MAITLFVARRPTYIAVMHVYFEFSVLLALVYYSTICIK